MLCSTSQG